MSDLKPGRKLDALIAEKVMGLELYQPDNADWVKGKWVYAINDCMDGKPVYVCDAKPYSTSIESAWEMMEKLKMTVYAPGASFANGEYGNGIEGWSAEVGTDEAYGCERVYDCATAPLAICLAALTAIDKLKKWV